MTQMRETEMERDSENRSDIPSQVRRSIRSPGMYALDGLTYIAD